MYSIKNLNNNKTDDNFVQCARNLSDVYFLVVVVYMYRIYV